MSKQKKSGNAVKNTQTGTENARIDQRFGRITGTLMTIYVLFYLCVFPLATHDKYFDILDFRFKLYWIPTFCVGILFLILGLIYLITDKVSNGGTLTAKLKENLKWNVLKTKLTKTDICFIALIFIMTLSVIFADYQYEALWGSRGRFNGLVLWLMFFIAYGLVTRFYHFKKWHLYAYLIAACLPEIWGITDFFMLDLLHFHVGGAAEYIYTFVSSVGNINTYTNMVALHFGASITLFVLSDCKCEKLLTFVAVVISSFAIVMGISDNGLLAAGAIFAFLPFVAWTSRQHIIRFFVTFSIFATSVLVTAYLTTQHATIAVADGGSVLVTIGKTKVFMLLTAALWLFTMVIAAMFHRKKSDEQEGKTARAARRIWLALFIVAVVAVIAVLVDANSGRHPEIWEAYKNVLIFSDTWGTGRGINWRFAWEFFTEKSSFLDKLIGNGPDTYYIITMDNFKHLMKDAGYGIFDSAHNEYLECLVTIGVLGTIAYIGMLATSLRQMLKNRKNVYAVACGFAILAYAVQAVVNIAIPITTPIFMILLYVGINSSQSSNFEKGTL